jgi:PD-(D/E)XK nuclease superfamily protein
MLFEDVTKQIIGAAYNIYNKMGFGYLEKVYEKCMMIELSEIDGVDVGDFVADLLINDSIVVELKSVRHLLPIHEVQLVNYLKATGYELGLLINFGEQKVGVRRKVRELKNG